MHQAVKLGSVEATVEELSRLLGREYVLTDRAEREFFSQDVYRSGQLPAAVIRPADSEELAAALRIVAAAGLAVVPRGGGMSYSDGYLPKFADSITVDLLRMDRVVEVNVEDGYVTVECGSTWKALNETLLPQGVRTPYWGPLSGARSSVGGALSQNSIFLGSGQYGPVADSVIGLDVVLIDGTILHLGSHSNGKGQPFFRQFGPDLMSMLLSDTGALGIKTRATFRLVRRPAETRHLSFAFERHVEILDAMAKIAREEIVSECFAFDPGLQAQRMKRSSLKDDVKKLGKVIQAAGGGLAGLKAGAQIVAAGRNFLEGVNYSLHMSFDGRDAAEVEAKVAIARRVIGTLGREVENSVPKVMRAEPFAEVNSMLGPGGERWIPVHGTVPFSRSQAVFEACEAVFERHREEMERLDIDHGYLLCTVARSGTLIEPVMYWPDARLGFHERVLAADYLAKLKRFPANPAAAECVARIRQELARTLMEHGAVSFQLGKFYLYQEGLEPTAAKFLRQIKSLVDPDGRMNPGSLGL